MFSGRDVEIPLGYIISEFKPSGSKKMWCCFLSLNFTILSSIDGQYLGPMLWICPE